jgi:hypothetical protein
MPAYRTLNAACPGDAGPAHGREVNVLDADGHAQFSGQSERLGCVEQWMPFDRMLGYLSASP